MKITDEPKTFTAELGSDLLVSSNHTGTHETPSLFVKVNDGFDTASWGTDDPEQVKKIIEHMAKMSGLTVTIGETQPAPEDFRALDRVRITTTEGNLDGEMATVVAVTPGTSYPIEVRTDDNQRFDVKPSEIRKVTLPESAEFVIGDHVFITALNGRTKHYGRIGVVVEVTTAPYLYLVELFPDGTRECFSGPELTKNS